MSLDCIAERFAKLRAMREQLCNNESNWKEAFHARDWMLDQLKELQCILSDESSTKDHAKDRVADLICVLEPVDREEDDD